MHQASRMIDCILRGAEGIKTWLPARATLACRTALPHGFQTLLQRVSVILVESVYMLVMAARIRPMMPEEPTLCRFNTSAVLQSACDAVLSSVAEILSEQCVCSDAESRYDVEQFCAPDSGRCVRELLALCPADRPGRLEASQQTIVDLQQLTQSNSIHRQHCSLPTGRGHMSSASPSPACHNKMSTVRGQYSRSISPTSSLETALLAIWVGDRLASGD